MTAAALKEAWAAIIIQKHCRGYLVRSLYQLIRVATITIQAYTRGCLARRRYRKVRLGPQASPGLVLFFVSSAGIPHFPALHRYCGGLIFTLKVCGNSGLSKSISTIFQQAHVMGSIV